MDYMHKKTDRQLAQLEKRLKVEYTKALKDLKKTAEAYFKSFAVLDEKKRKALDDNKITYDDYIDWRMGRMLTGEKYNDTIELMTNRLVEADKDASVLINGIVPDVYTKNYNYGETMIPKGLKTGIQFTFANPKTVNNILKVNNRVLPQSQIKIDKDKRWNNRKIRSALSQGVILGESIPKIAKRLQTVTDMDKNSAIRNARTAVTGAENAGRLDSFFEMRRLGLDPKKQWIATEDNRTRLSHRLIDGQIREIEEPFSNGLLYPGDSHINKPAEIYNCRCTLIAVFDDEEENEQEFALMDEAMANSYEYHRIQNGLEATPVDELGNEYFKVLTKGIDGDVKEAIESQFEELCSKYDTTVQAFLPMDSETYIRNSKSFAISYHNYEVDSSTIMYNPYKINDIDRLEKLINKNYAPKINTKLADKYVITHEFAHTLIDMGTELDENRNWLKADYGRIESIREEINDVYDRYKKNVGILDNARKEAELKALNTLDENDWNIAQRLSERLNKIYVSKYSLTNADEFMAECFSHYELGGAQNDYVDEIMNIINKNFRRK